MMSDKREPGDPNPYRSPATEPNVKKRPSWVGTAIIIFAIVVYGPMTVTPLWRAVRGIETGLMLLAFAFNGAVFVGLIWLGRWLRRRSMA